MTIDLDGPEPFFEQIADVLTQRIEDGTYPPRRRIPAEYALADEFGVSRPTVRAGIALLVEKGLVATSKGKGTFVTAKPGDASDA